MWNNITSTLGSDLQAAGSGILSYLGHNTGIMGGSPSFVQQAYAQTPTGTNGTLGNGGNFPNSTNNTGNSNAVSLADRGDNMNSTIGSNGQILGAHNVATGQTTTNTSGGSNNPPAPSQPSQPTIDPIQQAINDSYNSSMGYLNNLEGSVRSELPQVQNLINQNYNTSNQNLQNTNTSSNKQIDQQANQGDQRRQDALTAATRLYNELIQGGQQRFGGASSAGEAYQALAGRELQRNNQQTNTDYQNFMGQIATARDSLNTQYQNSLATLEQQRNTALQQAQSDFQDKLNQINSMRNQANQTKASARLSAIQDLRNQIFQINLANAQNQQSVQNYAKQIQDQLAQYEQSANQNLQNTGQASTAFNANTTLNPNTTLSMAYGQGAQGPNQYVGNINPNDNKDYMMGVVNPFIQNNNNNQLFPQNA